jgi:methylated-DNA-[protein]-cysteine S-methyltransferase
MSTFYDTISSPVGPLRLAGDGGALEHLQLAATGPAPAGWRHDPAALAEAVAQLRAYFAGELREFALSLRPHGAPFQRRVWDALLEIPYGETAGYGELARWIGSPGAARAVGGANARNPIALVIPCHRVIAADGTLGGYGGGLWRKRLLLDLEAGRPALAPAGPGT